jgi:hypothetical protein
MKGVRIRRPQAQRHKTSCPEITPQQAVLGMQLHVGVAPHEAGVSMQ